jgi:small subunit ribosomal protein S9
MAKRGKKAITSKAKKKKAVARAVIKEGRGRITINKRALETIEPEYVRTFIAEPLILAGDVAKTVDINVSVRGGGFMGQAVSARSAIAKALVKYTKDKALEKTFREYDRLLLVDDPRQKESKKPLGRGARAKKQKSKR